MELDLLGRRPRGSRARDQRAQPARARAREPRDHAGAGEQRCDDAGDQPPGRDPGRRLGDRRAARPGLAAGDDLRPAGRHHDRLGLHGGPLGGGEGRLVHRRRSPAGACTSTTSGSSRRRLRRRLLLRPHPARRPNRRHRRRPSRPRCRRRPPATRSSAAGSDGTRARPGGSFSVRLRVATSSGAPVKAATVRCTARVGKSSLRPLVRRWSRGVATCTWRLPRTAKGKRLQATVRVYSGGAVGDALADEAGQPLAA